jgi:hypothetical protein
MKTKLLFAVIALITFSAYAQEVPVAHNELPKEARDFLKQNFKSSVHHAIKDVDGRKITYEVVLNDDTEIEFEESGKWKEVDGKTKPIPVAYIQKQILDYIKISYPKEAIVKIERNDSEYEASLSSGMELKFDAMGTFTKVD